MESFVVCFKTATANLSTFTVTPMQGQLYVMQCMTTAT